jgi:hypothetical protein
VVLSFVDGFSQRFCSAPISTSLATAYDAAFDQINGLQREIPVLGEKPYTGKRRILGQANPNGIGSLSPG